MTTTRRQEIIEGIAYEIRPISGSRLDVVPALRTKDSNALDAPPCVTIIIEEGKYVVRSSLDLWGEERHKDPRRAVTAAIDRLKREVPKFIQGRKNQSAASSLLLEAWEVAG